MPPRPPSESELLRVGEAVRDAGGNQAEAARSLDMPVSTLKDWHKRLTRLAESGELGTDPVLPTFRLSKSTTVYDADGYVSRQYIQQKPQSGETFEVPPDQVVKGISALVDSEGREVLKWVKTKTGEIDPVDLAERLREVFDGLTAATVIPPPEHADGDLLTVYAIADAHIGMRAWQKEVGESYDVDIAVDRLRNWIGRLVASSPPSREAIILDVGDTTHMDDGTNQTPASKHVLDVDGRFFRTLDMTIAAMCDAVELALAKHETVRVVIIAGNHNPHSYMAILFAMAERYRDNPRVIVRKDPREFWAHQFGDCLLAAHHGDKAKPERLVMFLADEYPAEWGGTKHRYLWTGHLHHHKSSDIGGVRHEQLRAMTARDAYAYTHAYSARSQLQAITLHRASGEVQRQSVSAYSV